MIKIGSGMNEKRAGRKDSKFDTNFRNAGYASIHRGVYYYSYAKTTSDAKKEAESRKREALVEALLKTPQRAGNRSDRFRSPSGI